MDQVSDFAHAFVSVFFFGLPEQDAFFFAFYFFAGSKVSLNIVAYLI